LHELDLDIRSLVSRRSLVAAGLFMAAVAVVATTSHKFGDAVSGLEEARPIWLWAAAAGFLGSLLASAAVWRGAFRLCGAELSYSDAAARYGLGSLVNGISPARIGEPVRLALFGRALPGADRAWRTGGALGVITAVRAFVFGLLLAASAATGAVPLRPVLFLAGFVAVAGVVAFAVRDRTPRTHVAHLLDAFREIGRSPVGGARIVGWVVVSTAARFAGAIAMAAALGVPSPVSAALIILPALNVAGLIPLSGNLGVTSGAIAVALHSHGIATSEALTVGLAFHAVETAAGLAFGLGGVLFLVRFDARRLVVAGAAACLVAAFAATVLVPLA
jgi:lysylphosphatidylglycerol synthase-like protein